MKKPTVFDEQFPKFLDEHINKFLDPQEELMSFPYPDNERGQQEKRSMAIGLIFWKFLREAYVNMFEMRELTSYVLEYEDLAYENRQVEIVAMIESLPPSVWRKLLWRENIDFMSFESCLRRLNPEQIKAIKKNYDDLFGAEHEPRMPRVLKKSFRDRVKIFFGATTVEKLLQEDYDHCPRNHQSKGAYAFNLLSLDFGFSLYPKGNDDDTKITNQKFTRFLSIKEHINDFIVNQEDGKYWWLYKRARSNYAFYPNKDVQLKTHICPGFWATFISHASFWIMSPIALIITGVLIAKGFPKEAWLAAIFALPLIIWTLVAIIRLIKAGLKNCSKTVKAIGATIGIMATIFVLGVIIYGIGYAFGFLVIHLSPLIGAFLSVLVALAILFYVFFFLTCIVGSDPLFEYSDIPAFARFILHLSVAAPLLILFDKYLTKIVVNFFVDLATSIWSWYTDNLLFSNWFICTLVFVAIFAYFYGLFLNDEKRFARYQKLFVWLIKGFFTLTFVVFAVMFYQLGGLELLFSGLLPALSLAFILLLLGFSLIMLDQVNPGNIDERELALNFAYKMREEIGSLNSKNFIARILRSKWLGAMEHKDRWDTIDLIHSLGWAFFPHSSKLRLNLAENLVDKGSREILDIMKTEEAVIRGNAEDEDEIIKILQLIISGLSVTEAIEKIEADRTSYQRFKRRIKNFFIGICFPFILSWRVLVYVATKIKQFFQTLKDIWSLFNERCPYISRPRLLD